MEGTPTITCPLCAGSLKLHSSKVGFMENVPEKTCLRQSYNCGTDGLWLYLEIPSEEEVLDVVNTKVTPGDSFLSKSSALQSLEQALTTNSMPRRRSGRIGSAKLYVPESTNKKKFENYGASLDVSTPEENPLEEESA